MSLLSPPLQAFLAIVQHRTVHAAAAALHMTQTAVTQRIRGLEQRLKITLFVRSRRGMALTPEGEALLQYCLGAQELEGDVLAKLSGHATDAVVQVCISGPSSVMHSRVIPRCVEVLQRFPQLLIHFDISDTRDVLKSLRSGRCQFAILPEAALTREVQYKNLHPEQYVLVTCPQWKNRRLSEIIKSERIIDFNPSDTMTYAYLKHFHLYEHADHDRHYANRIESIALLIAQGTGYGVLTREFCQPYLSSGQLVVLNKEKEYTYQQVMVWYERPEPAAYFKAVIDAIE